MPSYDVTDERTGKQLTLVGDAPPTEQELENIFAQFRPASSTPSPAPNQNMEPWGGPSWPLTNRLQGYAQAALTNEPMHGFGEGVARTLPAAGGALAGAAQGAAMGAPLGPVGVFAGGVLGAGVGGAAAELARQGYGDIYGAATGGTVIPAGEAARGAGIEGLKQAAAQSLGAGLPAFARWAAPGTKKVAAQATRVMTGVPERTAAAAINDPSILGRAMTGQEAGEVYAAATPGLKSGVEGTREVFGKSYLTPEAAMNAFDEALPEIKDGTIDLQKALSLRQAMSRAISEVPMKQKGLIRALAGGLEELDPFIESQLAGFPEALKAYREAMIADEFRSWLPLNKNLSPNVLRTTAAIAAAVKGAADQSVAPMLALPMVSPRMWGYGIRAYGAASPLAGHAAQAAQAAASLYPRQQPGQ